MYNDDDRHDGFEEKGQTPEVIQERIENELGRAFSHERKRALMQKQSQDDSAETFGVASLAYGHTGDVSLAETGIGTAEFVDQNMNLQSKERLDTDGVVTQTPIDHAIVYEGGLLIKLMTSEKPHYRRVDTGCIQRKGGGQRGPINGFLPKSRRRFRHLLGRIRVDAKPLFVTLTYPSLYPFDSETVWKHLDCFLLRVKRRFPEVGGVCVSGYQDRGAPHFHLLLWNCDHATACSWMPKAWYDIVGASDHDHLLFGVVVSEVDHWAKMVNYFTKQEEPSVLTDFHFTGRRWSVYRRKNIPWAVPRTNPLSHDGAIEAKRRFQQYMGVHPLPRPRLSGLVFDDPRGLELRNFIESSPLGHTTPQVIKTKCARPPIDIEEGATQISGKADDQLDSIQTSVSRESEQLVGVLLSEMTRNEQEDILLEDRGCLSESVDSSVERGQLPSKTIQWLPGLVTILHALHRVLIRGCQRFQQLWTVQFDLLKPNTEEHAIDPDKRQELPVERPASSTPDDNATSSVEAVPERPNRDAASEKEAVHAKREKHSGRSYGPLRAATSLPSAV